MAKLSENKLRVGRIFVESQDIEGLVIWARNLGIKTLDIEKMTETFTKCFQRSKRREALWYFNNYFGKVDPDYERTMWLLGHVGMALKALVLGVVVYWSLFWLFRN